jgi:hypothetical protein
VGDLFDDQFVVGFALFSTPENAVGVPFHVFHVGFGAGVLVIRKGDRKAGFYFLGVHIIDFIGNCLQAIGVPCKQSIN